jgi:hypothetical protein
MNVKRLVATGLLILPLILLGANRVSAQATNAVEEYFQPQVVETTFAFEVGGKVLPAGKYDIEQPTRELLLFRPAKGPAVEAKVVTRLAQPATPLVEPKVVFDKVGDKYTVSEVWLPGKDGFLMANTPGAHVHHSLKAVAKKK